MQPRWAPVAAPPGPSCHPAGLHVHPVGMLAGDRHPELYEVEIALWIEFCSHDPVTLFLGMKDVFVRVIEKKSKK